MTKQLVSVNTIDAVTVRAEFGSAAKPFFDVPGLVDERVRESPGRTDLGKHAVITDPFRGPEHL